MIEMGFSGNLEISPILDAVPEMSPADREVNAEATHPAIGRVEVIAPGESIV